jgi:hypothetical protein
LGLLHLLSLVLPPHLRSATLGEVTRQYRSRIMRASFLLAHPHKQGLADSIDSVVNEVITTHMLLFAAADKLVLQLSLVSGM